MRAETHDRLIEAARHRAVARDVLRQAILAARAEHATLAEIGRVLGVSRQRIHQITKGATRDDPRQNS